MNPAKLLTLLAVAIASLLLVAGCGGDDGGDDDAKQQYADEVRAILEPLGADLQTLGTETSNVKSADDLAGKLTEVENSINSSIEELRSLEVPSGVEDVNDDLIAALETFNTNVTAVREAAESGDRKQIQESALELPQAALELQEQLQEVTTRAEEAGVPVGGEGTTGGSTSEDGS